LERGVNRGHFPETVPEPQKRTDARTLRLLHGTEIKVSIPAGTEQTVESPVVGLHFHRNERGYVEGKDWA
jgi:hypothetical protein